MKRIWELPHGKRYFVFLGPTGSGKSELALNFSRLCAGKAEEAGRSVHLIDMDQTKSLFRSREFRHELEGIGIKVNRTEDETDSHAIADGILGVLMDKNAYGVFDVGGNKSGAVMIGQYAEYLNMPEAMACYVINPLRPFSDTLESIQSDLFEICALAGLEKVELISNPCLGTETTPDMILKEHDRLRGMIDLLGKDLAMLSVAERHVDSLPDGLKIPLLPLKLHITYFDRYTPPT